MDTRYTMMMNENVLRNQASRQYLYVYLYVFVLLLCTVAKHCTAE
jgi:hypothetical protein